MVILQELGLTWAIQIFRAKAFLFTSDTWQWQWLKMVALKMEDWRRNIYIKWLELELLARPSDDDGGDGHDVEDDYGDDDYKDDAQRTCLPVRALSYAPSPPKTPQADKWQIFHNFNDFVFCVSSSFQVMNEEAKGKNRKLNTTKQRTAVFDIDY